MEAPKAHIVFDVAKATFNFISFALFTFFIRVFNDLVKLLHLGFDVFLGNRLTAHFFQVKVSMVCLFGLVEPLNPSKYGHDINLIYLKFTLSKCLTNSKGNGFILVGVFFA